MDLLVVGNILEVVVVGGAIASVRKVLSSEILDSTFVEDVLKMLESKGELEDGVVDVGCLPACNGRGQGNASQRGAGNVG